MEFSLPVRSWSFSGTGPRVAKTSLIGSSSPSPSVTYSVSLVKCGILSSEVEIRCHRNGDSIYN